MSASYATLIGALDLAQRAHDPDWIVFDCRFDLADPGFGRQAYATGHVPGAFFLDLDEDLSGAKTGSNGRHPLPDPARLAARLAACGVGNHTQVVAYDDAGGMFAARLWWLLRWFGHHRVAVLDGGLQAWLAAGGAVASGPAAEHPATRFQLQPPRRRLLHVHEVQAGLGQPGQTVIDARAAARFRGDEEPLDPVAGHIPGALNRPYVDNLDGRGCFKAPAQLRAEFDALLAGRDPAGVVHHCGSGVSAVPNLLAMELAGYAPAALYAGSWSEWCRTPGLPVARG